MGHSSPAGFETVLKPPGSISVAIHDASHTLKIVNSINWVKPKLTLLFAQCSFSGEDGIRLSANTLITQNYSRFCFHSASQTNV